MRKPTRLQTSRQPARRMAQMPSGNAPAATFDPACEQQYGAAIGIEFAGKGANVALGPTVNIVRDPRWGRSFETFGEDPYLAGQMAAANVQGIQSQDVMAEVKHAAVYNIERPAGTVVVDGTGRSAGTRTVTVTGKSAAGAFTTITFIWTVS